MANRRMRSGHTLPMRRGRLRRLFTSGSAGYAARHPLPPFLPTTSALAIVNQFPLLNISGSAAANGRLLLQSRPEMTSTSTAIDPVSARDVPLPARDTSNSERLALSAASGQTPVPQPSHRYPLRHNKAKQQKVESFTSGCCKKETDHNDLSSDAGDIE